MRDINQLLEAFNKKKFTFDGHEVHVHAVDMIGIDGKDTVDIIMIFEHPKGQVFKNKHSFDRHLFISNVPAVAEQIQGVMHSFAEQIREWEKIHLDIEDEIAMYNDDLYNDMNESEFEHIEI